MTKPLTPEGIEELALTSAQEYRLPVDRVTLLNEVCEQFDSSHKTLAVALALLSQHVTITTIVKAVIHADVAVAQQPRTGTSPLQSAMHPKVSQQRHSAALTSV